MGQRTCGGLEHKRSCWGKQAPRRAAAGALSARNQHPRNRQQEVGALVLERQHLLLRHHLRAPQTLDPDVQ